MAHRADRPRILRLLAAVGRAEGAAAVDRDGVRPGRHRRARVARGDDPARREGGRVLRAPPPRAARPRRDRRAHALRVHERGHQQPLLRHHRARRGAPGLAAEVPRRHRHPLRPRGRAPRRGDAVAHARPARDAVDHGQGARGLRVPPRAHRPAGRGHRVPRQVLGRHRHVLRARRRGSGCLVARGLARVRRVARPHLEPAHHPDRVARLAGRALRAHLPRQPGAAQPRHRHLDVHLARLLPLPRSRRPAPPARRRCRTR